MKKSFAKSFECLTTPRKINVYKSTVTNDYIVMDGDEELGTFRKGEGKWYFYDGTLIKGFEMLSELFAYIGETFEEQA